MDLIAADGLVYFSISEWDMLNKIGLDFRSLGNTVIVNLIRANKLEKRTAQLKIIFSSHLKYVQNYATTS